MKENHKIIFNPKLVTFLNNMESDYSLDFAKMINSTVSAIANTSLTKYRQNHGVPTGTELAVYIDKPKRTLTMKTDGRGAKLQLAKINDLYSDNSFKDSLDYRNLMTMANSSRNRSVHSDRRFTKFMICRDEVNIKVGLANPNKFNHLIKGTFQDAGKIQHYIFAFGSKKITGAMPINLPLIIRW